MGKKGFAVTRANSRAVRYKQHLWQVYDARDQRVCEKRFAIIMQEIELSLASHSRTLMVRFDLHPAQFNPSNEPIKRYLKALKRELQSRYGEIRCCYVREQESAATEHYHLVLLLNGHKVNHPQKVLDSAKSLWQQELAGNRLQYVENCYYQLKRGNRDSLTAAVYRASYLAKTPQATASDIEPNQLRTLRCHNRTARNAIRDNDAMLVSVTQSCSSSIDPHTWQQAIASYRNRRRQPQKRTTSNECAIDISRQSLKITDPNSGETKRARLFIALCPKRNQFYAQAINGTKLTDWIDGHYGLFDAIDGMPSTLIRQRLNPKTHPEYEHLAHHLGITARYVPAKDPRMPATLKSFARHLHQQLKLQSFTSLAEINHAIADLVRSFNQSAQDGRKNRRRSQVKLAAPPALEHRLTHIKRCKVHIDSHIQFERHHYSVPSKFIRQQVMLRATEREILVYAGHRLICRHRRRYRKGYTTVANHMPSRYGRGLSVKMIYRLNKLVKLRPQLMRNIRHTLSSVVHPEQAYRYIQFQSAKVNREKHEGIRQLVQCLATRLAGGVMA